MIIDNLDARKRKQLPRKGLLSCQIHFQNILLSIKRLYLVHFNEILIQNLFPQVQRKTAH